MGNESMQSEGSIWPLVQIMSDAVQKRCAFVRANCIIVHESYCLAFLMRCCKCLCCVESGEGVLVVGGMG